MQGKVSRRILARTVAAKLLAEPSNSRKWIRSLAAFLIDRGMEQDADLILNDISRELYLQGGHLIVNVTSARGLSEATRDELRRMLKAQTSAKTIDLVEEADPSLIGGLVARTPDGILDASVRTKLKQLASL